MSFCRIHLAHQANYRESKALMNKACIYDDQHVRVIHRTGSSPFTLATFSNMGFNANSDNFWGERVCNRDDLNAIGFVAKWNNWFPYDSMMPAIDAALRVVFGDVVTYGHSQGGYAAVRYSGALNAVGAIACAPQYSINPSVAMEDKRFTSNFKTHLHRLMEAEPADLLGNLALIYDPFDATDRYQVDLLRQACPAAFLKPFLVHRLGHDVIEIMKNHEVFTELLSFARTGVQTPESLLLIRKSKKRSYRYGVKFGELLMKHKKFRFAYTVLSVVEANATESIAPDDKVHYNVLFARACIALGQRQKATQRMEETAAVAPDNPHVQAFYGSCLMGVREHLGAVEAYRQAVKLRPDIQAFRTDLAEAERRLERATQDAELPS